MNTNRTRTCHNLFPREKFKVNTLEITFISFYIIKHRDCLHKFHESKNSVIWDPNSQINYAFAFNTSNGPEPELCSCVRLVEIVTCMLRQLDV